MMNAPTNRPSSPAYMLLAAGLLIALPMAGAALTGKNVMTYLEFPPLTRYVRHAPFDIRAFAAMTVLNVLMGSGIAALLLQGRRRSREIAASQRSQGTFPAWGWLGLVVMLLGWLLAWTRFPMFRFFQAHTFCLPWTGYILLVNAVCVHRSGRSLMTHKTGRFLMLFPASAVFWWFFEYLNRFVQNWYYLGVDAYSSIGYVLHASLAFSTVLPAVLSTRALLLTHPLFDGGLSGLYRISLPHGKAPAMAGMLVSAAGLMLIGTFPDLLYPLVWAAPLLIITSLQAMVGRSTIFSGLRSGNWGGLLSAALAALICGFFWELWNVKSLARWEYAIPFVDCCHIFAMPLLGYGGYLPFGLECLVAGQMVLGRDL
jgi:hypothetical membrane protein